MQALKAAGPNLQECGEGKWVINILSSLKTIIIVPQSKALPPRGDKRPHIPTQKCTLMIFYVKKDSRMLIDVIIWPSLASDVWPRPRPPPSVVVLGADDTLPYII